MLFFTLNIVNYLA